MPSVALLFDRKNDWLGAHIDVGALRERHGSFTIDTHHEQRAVRGYDVVFVLGYTRILPPSFLNENQLCLVVHESDLPRGKGFSPVQWQVLEGRREIPVCLFEAVEAVDAGPIYGHDVIRLSGYELFDDIRAAQAQATLRLIDGFLASHPHVKPEPQVGEETFYPRRTQADDELDVDQPLRSQFDRLRIANNDAWPATFTIDGHRYVLRIERA